MYDELLTDYTKQRDEVQVALRAATDQRVRSELVEQLNAIDKLLGQLEGEGTRTGDPVVDQWEREVEEGRIESLQRGLVIPKSVREKLAAKKRGPAA